MPSPSPPSSKREKVARFVSRLRSNRTAGSPLLVQTGFPTSLADLVVKNRSKLFTKRKKLPQLEIVDPIGEVGDDGGGLVVECPNVIDTEVEALGVEKRGGKLWLGLGFLGVMVVALGVLAVGGKWVVVGITILAFGLVGLEIFGVLNPLSKENVVDITNKDCLETGRGSFNLRGRELVSPIREIEPSYSTGDISMERVDSDAADDVNMDCDTGNSRKPKRKKLLRKLFRRKNRKKKDVDESNSCIDERTPSHEGVPMESQEISDEEYFSFEDANEVIEIKAGDDERIQDSSGDIGLGKWRKIAFFVVILLGLLGGKGLALVLTVVCYLLSACTGEVWKKWKKQ